MPGKHQRNGRDIRQLPVADDVEAFRCHDAELFRVAPRPLPVNRTSDPCSLDHAPMDTSAAADVLGAVMACLQSLAPFERLEVLERARAALEIDVGYVYRCPWWRDQGSYGDKPRGGNTRGP